MAPRRPRRPRLYVLTIDGIWRPAEWPTRLAVIVSTVVSTGRAELERRLQRANVPAEVTSAVLARTHQPVPGGSVREHFLRNIHPASLVAETALVPTGMRGSPQPFGVVRGAVPVTWIIRFA